ncbi:uncharacterized protein KQ657_004686 [Scheffersomyces spartinae]|uniref:Bromo domain-containing protein n=1 Tax=Scheffersomyces spartinae TaxID=45513 RepID=A0A9P8AIK6_9ASCO|nr:uncharacterized protein KQ657_004686 [Scheffersomyces spartinae]KAG7194473.1 hypothetical protein KQ657_004686 [Scheffersomyces spartinae]
MEQLNVKEQQEFQQIVEQKQMKDFMRLYSNLVARCFDDCVNDFTSASLTNKESACLMKCSEKFLKHSERIGQRYQEQNAMLQNNFQDQAMTDKNDEGGRELLALFVASTLNRLLKAHSKEITSSKLHIGITEFLKTFHHIAAQYVTNHRPRHFPSKAEDISINRIVGLITTDARFSKFVTIINNNLIVEIVPGAYEKWINDIVLTSTQQYSQILVKYINDLLHIYHQEKLALDQDPGAESTDGPTENETSDITTIQETPTHTLEVRLDKLDVIPEEQSTEEQEPKSAPDDSEGVNQIGDDIEMEDVSPDNKNENVKNTEMKKNDNVESERNSPVVNTKESQEDAIGDLEDHNFEKMVKTKDTEDDSSNVEEGKSSSVKDSVHQYGSLDQNDSEQVDKEATIDHNVHNIVDLSSSQECESIGEETNIKENKDDEEDSQMAEPEELEAEQEKEEKEKDDEEVEVEDEEKEEHSESEKEERGREKVEETHVTKNTDEETEEVKEEDVEEEEEEVEEEEVKEEEVEEKAVEVEEVEEEEVEEEEVEEEDKEEEDKEEEDKEEEDKEDNEGEKIKANKIQLEGDVIKEIQRDKYNEREDEEVVEIGEEDEKKEEVIDDGHVDIQKEVEINEQKEHNKSEIKLDKEEILEADNASQNVNESLSFKDENEESSKRDQGNQNEEGIQKVDGNHSEDQVEFSSHGEASVSVSGGTSEEPIMKQEEVEDDSEENSDVEGQQRLQTLRKRSRSPSNAASQRKRFQNIAVNLINSILEHRFSSPFLHPVSKKDAPDYNDVIYEPKDLKNILKSIKLKQDPPTYSEIKQLERDIILMFANCIMFNRSDEDLVSLTLSMKNDVNKMFKLFEEAEEDIK